MEEEKKKRGRPKKGEVREKKEVVLRKYREPAPKRTNAPGAGPPFKSEEEKAFTKRTTGIRNRNRQLKSRITRAKNLLKRVGEVPENFEKVEDIEVDNYVLFVEPNLDWVEDCYRNNVKEKVIYDTLGIPEQTWYSFLRKYPELKELKRRNRDVALAQVENAMFKRATGVTIKKEVAMKVAEKIFDENGKLVNVIERIEVIPLKEEVPADGNLAFKIMEVKRRKEYAKTDLENKNDEVNEALEQLKNVVTNRFVKKDNEEVEND